MAPEMLYAGFWRRLTAAILDQIILSFIRAFIFGILYVILYASLHLFEVQNYQILIYAIFGGCIVLLNIYVTWIYFALLESSSLQGTFGKLALGVRVYYSDETRALTFEEATKRYFAKIISRFVLLIGYILCAFSSKKQALHDFIAKSVLLVQR